MGGRESFADVSKADAIAHARHETSSVQFETPIEVQSVSQEMFVWVRDMLVRRDVVRRVWAWHGTILRAPSLGGGSFGNSKTAVNKSIRCSLSEHV